MGAVENELNLEHGVKVKKGEQKMKALSSRKLAQKPKGHRADRQQ